jgi:DNA repair protein RecO (recombination protein O)
MLQKTKGIVLTRFPYKEHDLIVTAYTQQWGKTTFLIYGSRKQKTKLPQSLFHPFSTLSLVADYRENRELQIIREASVSYVFNSLLYDMDKISVSMFLCEILSKSIQEKEENASLFKFIENEAITLDKINMTGNYHLYFLVNLMTFLGITPINNFNKQKIFFNLQTGQFSETFIPKADILNKDMSLCFSQLLICSSNENIHHLPFNQKIKHLLLSALIRYYEIHLHKMGEIKTLAVFKNLYSK